MQDILNECHSLEHLALTPNYLEAIYALSHPNVMWIDVWADIFLPREMLETFVGTTPSLTLPSVRRIRVFDQRLWTPNATELPALLPPEMDIPGDSVEYRYCGCNIVQQGHFVFQKDLIVNFLVSTSDLDEDSNGEEDDSEGSDFDSDASASNKDDTSNDGYL